MRSDTMGDLIRLAWRPSVFGKDGQPNPALPPLPNYHTTGRELDWLHTTAKDGLVMRRDEDGRVWASVESMA